MVEIPFVREISRCFPSFVASRKKGRQERRDDPRQWTLPPPHLSLCSMGSLKSEAISHRFWSSLTNAAPNGKSLKALAK